jgi:hypothetical protein
LRLRIRALTLTLVPSAVLAFGRAVLAGRADRREYRAADRACCLLPVGTPPLAINALPAFSRAILAIRAERREHGAANRASGAGGAVLSRQEGRCPAVVAFGGASQLPTPGNPLEPAWGGTEDLGSSPALPRPERLIARLAMLLVHSATLVQRLLQAQGRLPALADLRADAGENRAVGIWASSTGWSSGAARTWCRSLGIGCRQCPSPPPGRAASRRACRPAASRICGREPLFARTNGNRSAAVAPR